MNRSLTRILTTLALTVLLAGAGTLAEEPFDLKVELDIDAQVQALLEQGDVLRVTLRPAQQYGKSGGTEAVVQEKTYQGAGSVAAWRFAKALEPEQIYQLEVEIIRSRGDKSPISARYLSALDRLPRKPADSPLRLRLLRGHDRDARHTLVMIQRDSDGIFRMSVFTA